MTSNKYKTAPFKELKKLENEVTYLKDGLMYSEGRVKSLVERNEDLLKQLAQQKQLTVNSYAKVGELIVNWPVSQ